MPLPGTDSTGGYTEAVGSGNLPTQTLAAAGSVIANAGVITAGAGLVVVTGADDTKGVILPVASPGKVVNVYSVNATNGLPVYPQINSTINGGSANSSVVIEGKSLARFVGTNATNWAASYTANS